MRLIMGISSKAPLHTNVQALAKAKDGLGLKLHTHDAQMKGRSSTGIFIT